MSDTIGGAVHDLAVLERRMTAVRAVRQVLKAVWGLARAELPAAEAAAREAARYVEWTEEIAARLVVESPEGDASTLRVFVGPERAFAGALPRRFESALEEPGAIAVVGRRLSDALSERQEVAARVVFSLPGSTSPEDSEACAARVAEAILARATQERVVLVHPEGRSGLVVRTLLEPSRALHPDPPEMLSPLPDVIDAALREIVTARLAYALSTTLHAEVRSRLEMTEAARAACDRRVEELTRTWQVLRQEQVTSEIVEAVGAQLALAPRDVTTRPPFAT